MISDHAEHRIAGIEGLYPYFTLGAFSPGATGHLLQHLVRTLIRAEIRLIE